MGKTERLNNLVNTEIPLATIIHFVQNATSPVTVYIGLNLVFIQKGLSHSPAQITMSPPSSNSPSPFHFHWLETDTTERPCNRLTTEFTVN